MATTTNNTEKKNAKVVELLKATELKKFFVEQGIVPKYSDGSHYVGCGTSKNIFSVNPLKTRYNVYCSDEAFGLFKAKKGLNLVKDGNKTDKTRNNLIEVETTELLKEMLKAINGHFEGVRI